MTHADELVETMEKILTNKLHAAAEQLDQEVALAEGELRYGTAA